MTTHAASSTPFTLNEDQAAAVTNLLDFISNPNPDNWYFTFSGFAGTGKTTCMREVVAASSRSKVKFAFTAPTNKAAKVLASVTGKACTTFSLLGLRIDKSGELKALVAGKEPDLSELDVVFVDEASMVNSNLFSILQDRAYKFDFKVVFLGDSAQLPPVGEPFSQIWAGDIHASLTKVMRHDNEILELVTRIREQVPKPLPCITVKSNNHNGEGVWKLPRAGFKQSIYDAAARGDFADGAASKVIAWRNVRVAEYNDLIRSAIYGAAAVPGFYLPGDRIVATAPCERGEQTLLTTDAEAIVESAIDCKHPIEPKYNAIELKCRAETGEVIRLLVIHPSSIQHFKNDSEFLAHEAKANPRLWKNFWEHQDLFHQVKYAYALTAHRSQGSTYENVWVDSEDILYNRNRKEAFQCLYVACSRPTTRLWVV